MTKKQLVLNAFDNKPTERIPVGFWFHFTAEKDFFDGLNNSSIIETNQKGHLKFYREYSPDFVKLMSDGFFAYPNEKILNAADIASLRDIQPIPSDHPWIVEQVRHVRKLNDAFGGEVATFYNIFAPATYFKLAFAGISDNSKQLADYIDQDKETMRHVLDVIAQDVSTLARKVIEEGGADGIYLSVQNVQDTRITPQLYREVIAPSELQVLAAANSVSQNNILHICGYEGSHNDLTLYTDYPAKAINWAVVVEGVSLATGKKLFGGRAVIGGFDNTKNGVLYKGSKEEIEQETERLIAEAGKTGVILGADCTLPSDVAIERLHWVRDKAAHLTSAATNR